MIDRVHRSRAVVSLPEEPAAHGDSLRGQHDRGVHGDDGATLILALIFIVVISALATALTSWVTADLNNTSKFTGAQSIESAANSVAESALQTVRYTFPTPSALNASPPVPCLATGPTMTINEQNFTGISLSVWCSTFLDPLSTKTRTVTISTCLSSVSAGACALNPYLQAVVIFNDYPANGGGSQCNSKGTKTCGSGMTIVSWAFGMAPPTVTSVSEQSSGTCSSSTLVTVHGTGFSGATSVNFLPPVSGDTLIRSAIVSPGGIAVTACASTLMKTGTTYQVSVTTPAGTSANAGTNSSLTY